MSKRNLLSAIAVLLVAASAVRCVLTEEDVHTEEEDQTEEDDSSEEETTASTEETPPTTEEPTTTTEATTTERLPLRYQTVVRSGKRLMKETPKSECVESRRRRGEGVRTARTTEAPAGRSSNWRAKEIERRRGLRRASERGSKEGGKAPSPSPPRERGKERGRERGEERSRERGEERAKERAGRKRYVEYEESEVFEDGKPVVKKKRVVRPVKEDEDSVTESTQQISSTPSSEEEDEAPRGGKKRKPDEYEDLYRYFHEDDDEYDFGPIGGSSHRSSVRRRHYDPYQDYFDFVYSLTHPEDPHGHPPAEDDSTPEGSAFRKRYFKAWHSKKDREL